MNCVIPYYDSPKTSVVDKEWVIVSHAPVRYFDPKNPLNILEEGDVVYVRDARGVTKTLVDQSLADKLGLKRVNACSRKIFDWRRCII